MNFQNKLPFWYLVKTHKYGFSDFLLRCLNAFYTQYPEQETMVLYFLSSLFNHDKYVDGTHIMHHIFSSRKNNTHQLSCIFCAYVYLLFYKKYDNDILFVGTSERLNAHKIYVQNYFDTTLMIQWINIILSYFFDIGPVEFDEHSKINIHESLNYLNMLTEKSIILRNKTIRKLYNLSVSHNYLEDLASFFLGKKFPNYLNKYKNNVHFFTSLVYNYWPHPLRTYDTFSKEQTEILKNAIQTLHKNGDIDFFLEYSETFVKLFGKTHEISLYLGSLMTPSSDNDLNIIRHTFQKIYPDLRKRYFFQQFPVSDVLLKKFCERIQEQGFEKFLQTCYAEHVNFCQTEFKKQNYSLVNETFFLNSNSVFIYSLEQCIYFFKDNYLYIFLPEELIHLKNTHLNPYTNEKLPDSLFFQAENMIVPSVSILDEWKKILRRNFEFLT